MKCARCQHENPLLKQLAAPGSIQLTAETGSPTLSLFPLRAFNPNPTGSMLRKTYRLASFLTSTMVFSGPECTPFSLCPDAIP
jgi:hypothetical protein